MISSLPGYGADAPVSEAPAEAPRVTSRTLWALLLLATAVAMLLRLPELRVLAEQTVVARADAEVASDPTLRAIAVNTGLWMALFLSLVVAGLYLSLTSAIERRLLPVHRGDGRARAGLLFYVAAFATVPADLYCAMTGVLTLRGSPGYVAYLVAVGLLTPLGYQAVLARVGASRRVVIWSLSLSVALLSYVV